MITEYTHKTKRLTGENRGRIVIPACPPTTGTLTFAADNFHHLKRKGHFFLWKTIHQMHIRKPKKGKRFTLNRKLCLPGIESLSSDHIEQGDSDKLPFIISPRLLQHLRRNRNHQIHRVANQDERNQEGTRKGKKKKWKGVAVGYITTVLGDGRA